jgi:hypothetical protein
MAYVDHHMQVCWKHHQAENEALIFCFSKSMSEILEEPKLASLK